MTNVYLHFYPEHDYKGNFIKGRTVALEQLNESAINMIITQLNTRSTELIYRMKIGVANVHPKDQYNKKEGRKVAESKMTDVGVRVVGMLVNHQETTILFESEELGLSFIVKKYKDSKKIRFMKRGYRILGLK